MSYLLHVYDLDLTIIVLNVAQSVGSGVKSNVRRTVIYEMYCDKEIYLVDQLINL